MKIVRIFDMVSSFCGGKYELEVRLPDSQHCVCCDADYLFRLEKWLLIRGIEPSECIVYFRDLEFSTLLEGPAYLDVLLRNLRTTKRIK